MNHSFSASDDTQLLEDLKNEDPSGYTYYLAFGLFFASGGLWEMTSLLARRAMYIVDHHNGDPEKPVTGVEAAYLLAVSKRYMSKSAYDLKYVSKLLNSAWGRLKKYEGEESAFDIRLESERWALFLTYHMYRIFMNNEIPESIPSLKKCQDALEDLLNCLEHLEQNSTVKCRVERQMLANLFFIVLLRKYKENNDIREHDLLAFLKRFDKNVNSKDACDDFTGLPLSFRIDAIYIAAVWFLSKGQERVKAAQQLMQKLEDEEIDKSCVLPYDKSRYHFLKGLVATDAH